MNLSGFFLRASKMRSGLSARAFSTEDFEAQPETRSAAATKNEEKYFIAPLLFDSARQANLSGELGDESGMRRIAGHEEKARRSREVPRAGEATALLAHESGRPVESTDVGNGERSMSRRNDLRARERRHGLSRRVDRRRSGGLRRVIGRAPKERISDDTALRAEADRALASFRRKSDLDPAPDRAAPLAILEGERSGRKCQRQDEQRT